MAEANEKSGAPPYSSTAEASPYADEAQTATTLPKSWKYKQVKIGPWTLPYYASPQVQLLIVAFVCFMCPGMFNALSGIGGGGQLDHRAADDANMALYSTFAVIGFFAGTFTNVIGIKTALGFGGLGYSVYVASFLSYTHTTNYGFVVFAGTMLGVCAGLLWCAQGAIMMSYPEEGSKGKYISWFWMIFNLGAVIGSLIPLGQNIHTKTKRTVTDGTYIGFLILTLIGAGLAFTLVDTRSVIRPRSKTHIIMMKNPTWKTEILGLWQTLKADPWVLFLFPMFFASNWFYAYQFNGVNGARFNLRTAALNNVLYYIMQIVGAFTFGYALDHPGVRRTIKAKAVWVVLMVLTFAIWGGGYAFQKGYTRKEVDVKTGTLTPVDWTDSGYVGPMFLYMFYGFYDAAWQTTVYWYMGTLTNSARTLANYAGFYKGIQSAGSAIIWRLDSKGTPYMNLLASCWVLLAGGLVCAIPVVFFRVKESVPLEDDLKLVDETIEDVLGEEELRKRGLKGDATEGLETKPIA